MRPVRSFHVRPSLPGRLQALEELAYNLRWSWDHDTLVLFWRLDRDLWEACDHNPVLMLGALSQERLEEVSQDDAFLAQLDRTSHDLDAYVSRGLSWYRRAFGSSPGPLIAYFSMEFGITECLPIYSGGLGILAGDHLKSASDLGVPLVGVGLLYQKGYFRQYLSADGWQQERHRLNEFSTMPLRPVKDTAGQPVRIEVSLGDRTVVARLWRAAVGRVTLVLLDTNVPENPRELQGLTDELYGGDAEMRIRQEILLGMGGVRALAALGLSPRVYHMNEGHCAFLVLERIGQFVREHSLPVSVAREVVSASTVFTTHTPVPAGIDVFHPDLVERHLDPFRREIGMTREEFLDLGRVRPGNVAEQFSMPVLAIRGSTFVNGVSELHGSVSRRMWHDVWPDVPVDEVPITHVTNGVHPGSWISADMRTLYDRYLGRRWLEEPGDARVWQRAEQIPGEELWRTHERRRERLVAFARHRLAQQLRQRGARPAEIAEADEVLDPGALTIGFARRFATYKRATLLLRDPERLGRILNAPGRPVQVMYAGKAHPRDDAGKELIRQISQLARQPGFRHRIVFLEDYDATIARYLVEGVDVWLNTPRRPMEASGTSGMKAAFNGALNISILDGWWAEGYSPVTGWAVGNGEMYDDDEYQDRVEAGILYDLLEREVIPLFYARGPGGLPREWIARMKSAMGQLCPVFNTNRMVGQYTLEAYRPAEARRQALEQDDFRRARGLAAWRARLAQAWRGVRIADVASDVSDETQVGSTITVTARVLLGGLSVDDLDVQLHFGKVSEGRELADAQTIPMTVDGAPDGAGDGLAYTATLVCKASGTHGFTVRIVPRHPDLARAHETGLVVWSV
jgi:glycogen phosphorylase